jgi:hypothetical protein
VSLNDEPRRVQFDPNVRTPTNGTYVSGHDFPGVTVGVNPSGVTAGDRVILFEPEEGIEVDGTVSGFSNTREIVYVDVDWSGIRRYFRACSACPDFGNGCACEVACRRASEAVKNAAVIEAGSILEEVRDRQARLRHASFGGLPYVEREKMFLVVNDIARERFGSAWEALMRGEVSVADAQSTPSDAQIGHSGTDEDVYEAAATAHYADIVEPPYVGLGVSRAALAREPRFRAAVDAALEYERTRTAAEIESSTRHGFEMGERNVQLVAELAEARAEIETADRVRVECQHDRDQHAVLLREVLGQFTEHGHPGYVARRTPWVNIDTLMEWRLRVAATTAGDWRTERARLLAEIAEHRRTIRSLNESREAESENV